MRGLVAVGVQLVEHGLAGGNEILKQLMVLPATLAADGHAEHARTPQPSAPRASAEARSPLGRRRGMRMQSGPVKMTGASRSR